MLAVVIPTVALTVIGIRVVGARHADVRKAERVSENVQVVDRLIALRAALFAERVAAEIMMPDRRPPVEVLATTDFGQLMLDDAAPLSRATDEALDRLAPDERPFEPAELERIRAESDDWSRSPDTIRARLEPLTTRTEAVMALYTTEIRESAIELGDGRMIAAGTTFQRSIRLPDAAGEIVAAVSDLWAGAPDDRARLQSAVAARVAHFETVAELFAVSITDPNSPVAAFWRGPMQIPDDLEALLIDVQAGALSSPDRPAGEPTTVVPALLGAIDWTVGADRLPLLAADDMITIAGQVADDARFAERVTAALVLLAIGLSVTGAVLFGRSIISPVRRLTDHAERVGSGELTLDPLPLGGPPDVAVASAAVNDVVGTLRLLEEKTHALADLDLDHPSLAEPLPGELGAALQRSTEVLSTSISEREHLRSRLLYDATHDSLTGLANRAALFDVLDAVHRRDDPYAAVIFIDLDGFKQINDRLGHSTGDVVLQVTANRIAALAPEGSTVARLGGDEFVVVLTGPDPTREVLEMARAMVDAIAAPIPASGQLLQVRAGAGVATLDDPTSPLPGPPELLQRADLAVYAAKQTAPGTVVGYDVAFGRRIAEQSDVETALAAALPPGANELRVVYQPIIATHTGALVGLEVLVRWERAGEGRMLPDLFVPIAERSGLIVQLDMWVLRAATEQLAAWTSEPALADVPISVNVSGRTLLQESFVDDVSAALQAHAIAPPRLTVEVTETALVTDLGLAATRLEQLRALGVRVAIDDFGTGYTSIAHLRTLPVDELKIDGSFVRHLTERGDRVLVQLIRDVADLLGLFTVAEGVETATQIEALAAIGCDALQGYFYSEPLGAAAIATWVADRRHTAAAYQRRS